MSREKATPTIRLSPESGYTSLALTGLGIRKEILVEPEV